MSTVATILSPSSQLSLKRFPERDSDADDEDNISSSLGDLCRLDNAQSKRFKGGSSNSTESCFASPINMNLVLRSNRILQNEARFQDPTQHVLSPISELSMNLTDTSLDGGRHRGHDDGTTPIKRLRNGVRGGALHKHPLSSKEPSIISTKDYCIDDKLDDESSLRLKDISEMSRRIIMDLIWLYLTAVLFGAVKAKDIHDARLVRGQITTIGKAPFTVQLKNQYNMLTCGGALVTSRHVVTAAHCVEGKSPEDITIVGGATRSDEEGTRQGVKQVVMHPGYSIETGDADVAVLTLSGELTGANIETIPLCTKSLENFDFIRVFGWGWTEKEARVTDELSVISIPVLDQEYCTEQYKNYHMQITDNMMCAAAPGIMDSCTGDSGGPAVYEKQLCGIVSWGNGCGNAAYPGVYTRVVNVRDFIEKCIKN